MLRICLFDRLSLWADDRPLPSTGRREVDRLLAFLALHHAGPTARDAVAAALWPDAGRAQGLDKLRPQISHLQAYLRAQLPPPPGPWILADRDVVRWNPDAPCVVDAAAFDTWSAALLASPTVTRDGDAVRREVEAALELYRGPLLRDFGDAWAAEWRECFEARQLALRERLVDVLVGLGAREQALDAAVRLVAEDRLREESHRALARVHLALGDRITALRQLGACRAILRAELDVAPGPETRALAREIRAGRTAGARVARDSMIKGVQPTGGDDWSARRPSFPSRLVDGGRVAEAERLLGAGRWLTLVGPPGAGKSRVADAVARGRLAAASGGNVAWVDLARWAGGAGTADFPAACRGRTDAALVVLDNAECHLDASVAIVRAIVTACDRTRVVVTSREPLNLAGERTWEVPLLGLPAAMPGAGEPLSEAETLFADRAGFGGPASLDRATRLVMAEVCRGLDGLPMAIERAAAAVREGGWERLGDLSEDGPGGILSLRDPTPEAAGARFDSLGAALAWSYDRLPAEARVLMARLAALAGPFSIVEAEAMGTGDLGCGVRLRAGDVLESLERLIACSLVVADVNALTPRRHRLLSVIRRFARHRLAASGELVAAERRASDLRAAPP